MLEGGFTFSHVAPMHAECDSRNPPIGVDSKDPFSFI